MKCINCTKDAKFFNGKGFFCSSCISDTKGIQLFKSKLGPETIEFISIKGKKIGFLGLEYSDSSLLRIIDRIKETPVINDSTIVLSRNKKLEAEISEKIIGRETQKDPNSKYSLITINNQNTIFLNCEFIRDFEVNDIIGFIDYQIKIAPNKNIVVEYTELYKDIIMDYNSKIGIDFLNFIEPELEMVYQFRDLLIATRSSFFTLRDKKDFSEMYIRDYINRQVLQFSKKYFIKGFDEFPDLIALIRILIIHQKLILLNYVCKTIPSTHYIFEEFYEEIDWKEYDLVKSVFIKNFNKYKNHSFENFDDSNLIEFLKSNMLEMIKEVPPIFYRYSELFSITDMAHKFSEMIQYGMLKNDEFKDDLEILLMQLELIELNSQNLSMKFWVYRERKYLNQQRIMFLSDKNALKDHIENTLESIQYYSNNISEINKSISQTIYPDDFILEYNGLSYTAYSLEDFDNFKQIRNIISEKINSGSYQISTKIMVYFQSFFLEEDYNALKKVFKLYDHLDSDTFEIRGDQSLKSAGIFSNAFFTDDFSKKSKLYADAIEFNNTQEIIPTSMAKDISQRDVSDLFYKTIFTLEKSLTSKSSDEVKGILDDINEKIPSKYLKNIKPFESIQYFNIKNNILYNIINSNHLVVKRLLQKISNFEFYQSHKFQKFIKDYLEIIDNDNFRKLKFIASHEYTDDIWIRIIKKFLILSINDEIYNDFKQIVKTESLDNKAFQERFFISLHDFTFYARQHSRSFKKLDEEEIRDLYLVILKHLFSAAEGEVFNYDGKSDLKATNPNNKYEFIIAELKKWNSTKDVEEVYMQTVRKHSSGQEKELYIIMLNYNKDIAKVHKKIRESILSEPETISLKKESISPEGSKEIFEEYDVNIRGNNIPLKLGIVDLYHEKV